MYKRQAHTSTPSLVAANGTEIPTYGKRTLTLSFCPGQSISQVFWIAAVKRPILGANFFIQQGLVIDPARCRLLDTATGKIYRGRGAVSHAISGLRTTDPQGPYEAILHEFPDLLVQSFSGTVKHPVRHYIETTGPPTPRQSSPAGQCQVGHCQGGVQEDGGPGNNPPVGLTMGIATRCSTSALSLIHI